MGKNDLPIKVAIAFVLAFLLFLIVSSLFVKY